MLRPVLGACALVLAVAGAMLELPADRVERYYSLAIYPTVQVVLTTLTNWVPFALLDVLLVAGVSVAVFATARAIGTSRRRKSFRPLLSTALGLAAAAAAVYVLFLAVWGLNYRRVPMERRVLLAVEPPSNEAVLALGLEAVRHLNTLHAAAHQAGWYTDVTDDNALTHAAAQVQAALTGVRPARLAHLKQSVLGPYFRWTGVDGMVNPFGLEVIANPDLLPFERPFVAAHEWAHLAGFADEAEANFVGFLTCVRASTPAQYSGWLYLYWQIAAESDNAARARLREALHAGPRGDVAAVVSRLQRGEIPRLRLASWLVYDEYLRANRVDAGIRSYGEVINLLVRARFDPGWTPIRGERIDTR